MRRPALGLIVCAVATLGAPATATAVPTGSYEGSLSAVSTRFEVEQAGGRQVANNVRLSGSWAGCPNCSIGPFDGVVISGGRASFITADKGIVLEEVVLRWSGEKVNGAIRNVVPGTTGAFLLTPTPIAATLQNNLLKADSAAAPKAAAAPPPAFFAATRPEYVGQLDPICQNYEKPALKLVTRFYKQTAGVIKVQAKQDPAVTERQLLGPFGSLLRGIDKLVGKLTTQIAAVPPPAGDELAVAQWLAGRRAYRRTADRAAAAGKVGAVGKLFTLLGRASTRFADGEKAVASFGFQSCIG